MRNLRASLLIPLAALLVSVGLAGCIDATTQSTLSTGIANTNLPSSVSLSQVTTNRTTLIANNVQSATITVRLKTQLGALLPGHQIQLASGRAGDTVQAVNAVSDANGRAVFTVTSTAVGTTTFYATDLTSSLVLAQSVTIVFTPGPVDGTTSTIVANNTQTTVGPTGTRVVVTLKDAFGNPVPQKFVILDSSRGATDTVAAASGQMSDSDGQVSFTISSFVSGPLVFTATDVTDALVFAQSNALRFIPGPMNPAHSSVVAGASNVTVGTTTALSIVAKDQYDNALEGQTLVVTSTRTGDSILPSPITVDASGNATANLRATLVGTSTYTVTSLGAAFAQHPSITYIPAPVDPALSTVTFSPTNYTAGGSTTATVTLRDQFSNRVTGGVAVSLTSSRGASDTITTSPATTDATTGVATFTVASTVRGVPVFTVVGGGITLSTTPSVTVQASTFDISQTTISGAAFIKRNLSTTVSMLARDQYGNATSFGVPTTFACTPSAGAGVSVLSETGTATVTASATISLTTTYLGVTKGTTSTISCTIGGVAVPVTTTVTVSNTPATLTSITPLTGATEETAYASDFATLFARSDAADVDSDTISFRIESVNSGTLTRNGGAVTAGTTRLGAGDTWIWTPGANAEGAVTAFTVRAYDGFSTSTTAIPVVIQTAGTPDPPTMAAIAAQSMFQDTSHSFAITIADPDVGSSIACSSSALSWTSTNTTLLGANNSAQITFSGTVGACQATITPVAGQTGTANVTFTVSDGTFTASRTFALSVSPPNDPPTISAIAATSTAEDTAKAVSFTIGDPDTALVCTSANLSMSSSSPAIVANTGVAWSGAFPNCTATITPVANAHGSTTITISVTDGGTTVPTSFALTVTSVDDAPVATAQTVNANVATGSPITLAGVDVDGDALTYAVVASPTHGVLTGTAPNLTYTFTDDGVTLADSFTFRVNDGHSNSATATVNVTINGVVYFCNQGSGLWSDAANWFDNAACSSPIARVPASGEYVSIQSGTYSDTPAAITLSGYRGAGGQSANLTIGSVGMLYVSSGTWSGSTDASASANFAGTARNAGAVLGNATFNGSSYNTGAITGNARFNAAAGQTLTLTGSMRWGGTIGGQVRDGSGSMVLNWIFNATDNAGTVPGNATFNTGGANTGSVTGTATFNAPSTAGGSYGACAGNGC
jgi:hypothetical protein